MLIDMISSDAQLKRMLEASIAAAAALNPDRNTNPAQNLEEFIDFVEWSSTTLPRFILKLPTGASLYDHMDQGVDYFYFLIDQPLAELEGKGYYHPSIQYHEPFSSWVKEYCRNWGRYLSTEDSWKPEYAADFYTDPVFGVPEGWYEDSSNWKTYNDFFARRLRDASVRPVKSPDDDSVMTSPVDGYPQGVWAIDDEGYIVHKGGVQLKSRYFDYIPDLVGPDSAYRDVFAGGTLTHIFLDVNDYHRYHFPIGGEIKEMNLIPAADAGGGVYHWDAAAGRYILDCDTPGWETVETRSCMILDTEKYGYVALMPIGMSQICSVNYSEGLAPGVKVKKGQELGYFLFGGSDFVIIFQKGVRFDFTPEMKDGHILFGELLGRLSR